MKTELDVNYNTIKVSSLADYIEAVNTYAKRRQIGPRLYRGQSQDWDITSTMYRTLQSLRKRASQPMSQAEHEPVATAENKLSITPRELADYVDYHLRQSRLRESGYPAIQGMDDLRLLAEIQQMGGDSPLIDFTANPLIALYFACAHDVTKDGVVSAITPYNNDKMIEFTLDKNKDKDWRQVLDTSSGHGLDSGSGHGLDSGSGRGLDTGSGRALDANSYSYFWHLPRSNQRILKQSGYVMFNNKGYIAKLEVEQRFIVPSNNKLGILHTLDTVCGINRDAVYPDFLGYIERGK